MDYVEIQSPLGVLYVRANDVGITAVSRAKPEDSANALVFGNSHIKQLQTELAEYFAGVRQKFDVAMDLRSFTVFQQAVWQELLLIPYGCVISYKELALRLGDAKKVRAVGRANGANPIPIVIPCHRVIGSTGLLVGYSQGLDMKEYLLSMEGFPLQGKLF